MPPSPLVRGSRMLGTPYHYRDDRNIPVVDETHSLVGPADLYAANGLQFLPFNTLYQLAADRSAGVLDLADGFLLIPDLINYWLTGRQVAEQTNASTTGLLSVSTGGCDRALIGRLGLPLTVLPELVAPGTVLGSIRPEVDVPGLLTSSALRS